MDGSVKLLQELLLKHTLNGQADIVTDPAIAQADIIPTRAEKVANIKAWEKYLGRDAPTKYIGSDVPTLDALTEMDEEEFAPYYNMVKSSHDAAKDQEALSKELREFQQKEDKRIDQIKAQKQREAQGQVSDN